MVEFKTLMNLFQHLNKVDGVMLGRSAYDNPMITSQVDERIFNTSPQIMRQKKKY